jgi:hypothetical protein
MMHPCYNIKLFRRSTLVLELLERMQDRLLFPGFGCLLEPYEQDVNDGF